MKKTKAFTLVELIITITLIAILSLISVPLFKNHIIKAQRTEGYALISAIRDAQKQYYMEYGDFLGYSGTCCGRSGTNYETVLNIDARGNKYYTWFSVNIHQKNAHATYFNYFEAQVYNNLAGNITCKYSPSSGEYLCCSKE